MAALKKISAEHILSLCALITAVIAVWVAVAEQQANREYQRLSVEPYLELSNTNRNGYERVLTNTGLGPARIQSVKVTFKDKPALSWLEITNEIIEKSGEKEPIGSITYSSLWRGRQIQAGESTSLLHVKDRKFINLLQKSIPKANMEICYCSMYKDCWIKENSKVPKQVEQCEMNAPDFFG